MAKHASGQKLVPVEYGRLGAWKARLLRLGREITGRTEPPARPAPEADHSPEPADPGPVAPTAGGAGLAGDSAVLIRQTTGAVCSSLSTLAQRIIGAEATKAGANGDTLKKFERAAAMPDETKLCLVETSPAVVAAMGMDPAQYPLIVFGAALTAWGAQLAATVAELRALQKQRPAPVSSSSTPPASN